MASELTNYLEDDWDDNNLTGRTSPSKGFFKQFGDGGAGDLLKGVYRPRWETVQGSPSVTSGRLHLSASETVAAPSVFTVGSWEVVMNASGDSQTMKYSFFARDTNVGSNNNIDDGYIMNNNPSGGSSFFNLFKRDGGSGTNIIQGSAVGTGQDFTAKTTRDSYGGFELFRDGTSQGTATDTTHTESIYSVIGPDSNSGTYEVDDLVYV